MKKILVFLFFLFCSIAYSEDIATKPSFQGENEYFLSPTLGWGPIGVLSSLDFMYRNRSGFAMFINFNIAVPLTPKGGIVTFQEFYLGYSLKKGSFYATFAGGLWAGCGLGFYTQDRTIDPSYGGIDSDRTSLFVLTLFALRNDYAYFFTEKVGITVSHTHGVGLNMIRWIVDDKNLYIYNFLLKIGATFRI